MEGRVAVDVLVSAYIALVTLLLVYNNIPPQKLAQVITSVRMFMCVVEGILDFICVRCFKTIFFSIQDMLFTFHGRTNRFSKHRRVSFPQIIFAVVRPDFDLSVH